jgi:hypothetical protein
MADLLRDVWIREAGTGQQGAQLRDRYMVMMMMVMMMMMMMTKTTTTTMMYMLNA